ncbi:MAG: hypothetical protein J0L75_02080 [Spirochaetes bacterium]|nr:hypothetical protein [Spirochaetota bacterium]
MNPWAAVLPLLLLAGCRSARAPVTVLPVRLEPRGQWVVASRTDQAGFEETVTRDLLAKWVRASALIRVDANLTFDYYFDFRCDRARVHFDPATGVLTFAGGPLRVKKPVINRARVLILEKSLWINEEREARKILEGLTDRLASIGAAWREEPAVRSACEAGLRDLLAGLARDNGWAVKETRLGWAP